MLPRGAAGCRAELRKESAEVKDKLQAAEQAVTGVLGDIQRMPSRRGGTARRRSSGSGRRAKACAHGAQRAEESLGVKEKTVAAIRVTVGDLEAQAADLRGGDRRPDLDAKLTKAERVQGARASSTRAWTRSRRRASPRRRRGSRRRLSSGSFARFSSLTSKGGSTGSRRPPRRWTCPV